MADYGKVDNPTLDIKDYKKGDFVQFLIYDTKPSYGIVSRINEARLSEDNLHLIHFEDGSPFEIFRTPKYGGIRKATEDEALTHFHSISDRFEKKIQNGGLMGAVYAREQYHLNSIIENLETNGVNPYKVITTRVKEPETGLYVLVGIYSGQGGSKHLEGLVSVPRLSEKEVSEIMIKIKPDGFGNIPSDVYNTPATSHGSLVAMRSYEVPEKARDFVPNPKILEDIGSEWRFSETFAKK